MAIRMKYERKFEKLEDKLYKVLCVDRRMNKIEIVYIYPQVVQPIVMKYEPVLVTDKDIKIIFSIVRLHSCLSCAKLYINM